MNYNATIDECFTKINIKKWNSYDELKYFNLERAAIATMKKKTKREQYFSELKQTVINRLLLYFSNYHINDLTADSSAKNL
ncbi:hypothetical protein [Spiroplasma endosymbiont of Labia minor]|uniref:hypothetical protein n=1 Tax=Spiroplasma endosymbiont of Labia minor TaxID=3066305 RepID=UPI0030CCEBA4